MNDEVEAIAAHLKDAVARQDADTAGRILTDHLGELMMHDVAWTCATMAEIDIRMAVKYPALAVAHPHRQQLVRHYPRDAQLPLISSRDRPQSWLYGMAFVRATGRVRLAQEYANRLAANLDHVSSAGGPPLSRGHEWLVRFQLGLTRLAAGELQQATEEFGIASRLVRFPGRDQISDAARLTFGYLALIAALSGATALARHHLARSEGDSLATGSPLWGLLSAARAIVEVEENTPESDEAVAALELIDDQDLFWPYALLAQTRHAELHNRPLDALATVRLAESLRKPEPGSFAHDILVARRIEALVILGRIGAARATYEDRAVDAPHCQLAFLALLLAENNFNGLEPGSQL